MEELVERAAAGDEVAWQLLWKELEPMLLAMIARPRFLGRLGQREDDRRNIVVEVMSRLRADNCRRLQSYVATRAANPSLAIEPWLRVVAKRVAIDYLRAHPDYIDRRREPGASAPGKLIVHETLTGSQRLIGERPPVTNRSTAQQMLRYAATEMPDDQRRALELWTSGNSYEDIARALGVTDAEKLVRAAVERLRRKFREDA
jgi:DNA-directed RNA polymerase specialized sigma24 family protein